jgi:hypothetical protein
VGYYQPVNKLPGGTDFSLNDMFGEHNFEETVLGDAVKECNASGLILILLFLLSFSRIKTRNFKKVLISEIFF